MQVGLEGKVVIVTGAAQGIGRAIALRCAEAGAAGVLATDRQAADAVADELTAAGAPAACVRADLEDDDAPARIVEACQARFGRVDALANAAGITTRASLAAGDEATFDRLFRVNTRAPAFLMQRCIAAMRVQNRDQAGAGGAIVNVLTQNIHGGGANIALYSASKAALALLTRNGAHAHRRDRVRINGINVGWVDTPAERVTQSAEGRDEAWLAARAAEQPFGRLLEPDDVARLALFLISDVSIPMTGALVDQEQWVAGARD